jgi:hypothetical protein
MGRREGEGGGRRRREGKEGESEDPYLRKEIWWRAPYLSYSSSSLSVYPLPSPLLENSTA